MEKLNIKAEIKNGVSKKNGKNYTALELEFPNGYKKMVFLDYAEQYMLFVMNGNN